MTDTYLWTSNGGCPLCDAMDGYHFDREPTRPHYYCDCDIELVDSDQDRDGDCYTIDITIDSYSWSDPDSLPDMDRSHPVEIGYHFEIACWNGGGMSGDENAEFDAEQVFEFNGGLELGADDWPVLDLQGLEDAIHDRLVELAEEICHCDDMPPVDDLVA